MEGKVIDKIAAIKSIATKKELILIDRITKLEIDDVIHMSINELANKISITESTIVRFCRKIGYKGYYDFKLALSQDLSTKKNKISDSIIKNSYSAVVSGLNFTAKNIDMKIIHEVSKQIIKAKKVCVFGIGNSYVPTMYFYNALVKHGINVWVSADSHIRNLLASNLSEDDFVLFLSSSGETLEIINLAKKCKELNAKIAVLTNQSKSTLASYAPYLFLSSTKDKSYKGSEASSIASQMFILDVLVNDILGKFKSAK